MIWIGAAFARDVDLKVHDMKGALPAGTEVVVELASPGKAGLTFTCRDDGAAPDAIAGDRLYTARASFDVEFGTVKVRAGGSTWEGGFRFDADSDPVLLVGLEANGFAAASTREVMFVPQEPMVAPSAPGAAAPGVTAQPSQPAGDSRRRTGLPDGMWLGWIVAAAAVAGLGGVAWAGAARTARIPPVEGTGRRVTTASRGPYVPGEGADLWLGTPAGPGARVAAGRWTPTEVALATARVSGPVRVVVTDPSLLEAEGDGYAALAEALDGVADLLWVG